jgi:hypothetical protein
MSDWPGFAPKYVTALPSNEADGMEIYFEADGTNGVVWHLRYVAALTKWVYLGGASLVHEVAGAETTTSTTYADLSGGATGPTITLPLAGGLWEISIGAGMSHSVATTPVWMSFAIGGSAAADTEGFVAASPSTAGGSEACSRTMRRSVATAAVLLSKYKASAAGTLTSARRFMTVRPVTIDPV